MFSINHNSKLPTAAVITVGVDTNTASKIISLIEDMNWSVTTSKLETHISANRRPSFAPQMKFADICIAIVDFEADPKAAGETTNYLHHSFPGKLTVIGLASNATTDVLLLAMRAGCSEFLHGPLEVVGLKETLGRIQEFWLHHGERSGSSGFVISVFGAKGGVGVTTLSVHLAVYLAQIYQKRTLLIDFHRELGHVCVYLGLDGSLCDFNEVVRNVNRLDSELLHGFVGKHSSGLDVLSSPDTCCDPKSLDIEAVHNTMEFLRGEYDYIVLDCTTSLIDVNLAVVAASGMVYLVTTPDVAAIRGLCRYADKLMEMDDMAGKIKVIVNCLPSPHTISIEQIEKAVRMTIDIKFAAGNNELIQAGNLGEPIPPTSKSDFATNMKKWAGSLVGSAPSSSVASHSKRRFSFRK